MKVNVHGRVIDMPLITFTCKVPPRYLSWIQLTVRDLVQDEKTILRAQHNAACGDLSAQWGAGNRALPSNVIRLNVRKRWRGPPRPHVAPEYFVSDDDED